MPLSATAINHVILAMGEEVQLGKHDVAHDSFALRFSAVPPLPSDMASDASSSYVAVSGVRLPLPLNATFAD